MPLASGAATMKSWLLQKTKSGTVAPEAISVCWSWDNEYKRIRYGELVAWAES